MSNRSTQKNQVSNGVVDALSVPRTRRARTFRSHPFREAESRISQPQMTSTAIRGRIQRDVSETQAIRTVTPWIFGASPTNKNIEIAAVGFASFSPSGKCLNHHPSF